MKRQRRSMKATQGRRWRSRRREDDEDTGDEIDEEMLACIGDDQKPSAPAVGADS
ncbi:MAG TPA: hypothetical protein VGG01_04015 [Xanthobacteraceae bacterium]